MVVGIICELLEFDRVRERRNVDPAIRERLPHEVDPLRGSLGPNWRILLFDEGHAFRLLEKLVTPVKIEVVEVIREAAQQFMQDAREDDVGVENGPERTSLCRAVRFSFTQGERLLPSATSRIRR